MLTCSRVPATRFTVPGHRFPIYRKGVHLSPLVLEVLRRRKSGRVRKHAGYCRVGKAVELAGQEMDSEMPRMTQLR